MDKAAHNMPPLATANPGVFTQLLRAEMLGRSGAGRSDADPAKWEELRLALRQKGVNLDWLTAGQQQYAEMDFHFDRMLDDDYHQGTPDTFITPVREPEKTRAWREREEERRRSPALSPPLLAV